MKRPGATNASGDSPRKVSGRSKCRPTRWFSNAIIFWSAVTYGESIVFV
jgi:hypothetical protein